MKKLIMVAVLVAMLIWAGCAPQVPPIEYRSVKVTDFQDIPCADVYWFTLYDLEVFDGPVPGRDSELTEEAFVSGYSHREWGNGGIDAFPIFSFQYVAESRVSPEALGKFIGYMLQCHFINLHLQQRPFDFTGVDAEAANWGDELTQKVNDLFQEEGLRMRVRIDLHSVEVKWHNGQKIWAWEKATS